MKLTEWVSERSASSKLKLSLVVSVPVSALEPASVTPPVKSSPAITGASLVPVIVTWTVAVSVRAVDVGHRDGERLDQGLAFGEIGHGGGVDL